MSSLVQSGLCSPHRSSCTSWGWNVCSFSMGKTLSKPPGLWWWWGREKGRGEGGEGEMKEVIKRRWTSFLYVWIKLNLALDIVRSFPLPYDNMPYEYAYLQASITDIHVSVIKNDRWGKGLRQWVTFEPSTCPLLTRKYLTFECFHLPSYPSPETEVFHQFLIFVSIVNCQILDIMAVHRNEQKKWSGEHCCITPSPPPPTSFIKASSIGCL